VALILKYNFIHADIKENDSNFSKKRKIINDPPRNETILEYSYMKLPANIFLTYLKEDAQYFINRCLRYAPF